MPKRLILVAAAALALGGCLPKARIALPGDFAAGAEQLEIAGMGIGRRGDFRFAKGSGSFERGAETMAFLDRTIVRNKGGGSFRFTGPDGTLSGSCRYREEEVNVGIVSDQTRPFAYRCQLTRDGRPAGELRVGEELGTLGAMVGNRRRGELLFEGLRFEVRSIHRHAGGGLPTDNPLGYRFEAQGRTVGAIDVNGQGKTVFAPAAGPERTAVLAGSLALAILWDPAAL